MKAVIFDMDGVLTDSEPAICAAAQAMFREYGAEVPEEDFVPYIGAGENKYIGGPAKKHGVVLDLMEAKARTYEIYLEIMPNVLKAFPGAVASDAPQELRPHPQGQGEVEQGMGPHADPQPAPATEGRQAHSRR
jgi:phosphoglycolate phosphatase-like HAD superfamily hydrolase